MGLGRGLTKRAGAHASDGRRVGGNLMAFAPLEERSWTSSRDLSSWCLPHVSPYTRWYPGAASVQVIFSSDRLGGSGGQPSMRGSLLESNALLALRSMTLSPCADLQQQGYQLPCRTGKKAASVVSRERAEGRGHPPETGRRAASTVGCNSYGKNYRAPSMRTASASADRAIPAASSPSAAPPCRDRAALRPRSPAWHRQLSRCRPSRGHTAPERASGRGRASRGAPRACRSRVRAHSL